MKRRYVLKNKKRFAAFMGTLIVILIITAFAYTAYGYKEPSGKIVMIQKGDTLWDLAKANCDDGDIRIYLHKIKEVNHLKNSDIYEGAMLVLPAR